MNQTKGEDVNLQELIARRKAELRRGFAQMEKVATAAGHPISRSMLHTFATRPLLNIPTTASLHAIAAALDVEPREVLEAAARSIGMTPTVVELNRTSRAMLTLLADRSPAEIDALATALRAITNVLPQSEPMQDRANSE